jgi:hypothetical protein
MAIAKVLIANRGEIVVRVVRACRDAGIGSVAAYANPDRNAPHVRAADEAFALADDTSATSYLDIGKVLVAAAKSVADAVHPGYGFLSGNADFAQAVFDVGLTWIGLPPHAIRDLGDKVFARKIAQRAGAPLVADRPRHVENLAMADITSSIRAEALRLFAVLPSIIAADQRRRQELGAIAPRDHLGYAANFLYMTFGKVPEPQIVAAFETFLILYAEHSTSACTDRVLTAASSDLYSAVAVAVGTLKGSPHACASEAVMTMLNEIAIPDNAKPWLEEAPTAGQEIVGFGHHVCKNGGSRVATMRAALGVIGPAYHLVGLDASAFTPILVASIPGWTARVAGQLAPDSLIRPFAADDGSVDGRPAAEGEEHVRGAVG